MSITNQTSCDAVNWNCAESWSIAFRQHTIFTQIAFCMCYVCLLWLYTQATSKTKCADLGQCALMATWYPMVNQAASTMTWYPTQSFCPDSEPTSPCPMLIMPSTQLGSDKYQHLSHWFDSTWESEPTRFRFPGLPKREMALYSFGHPIWYMC